MVQADRVAGGLAFGHRAAASDADGGGVDRVGDVGHGWRVAGHQIFEAAAAGAGDGRLHGAGVFVDVVSWCWNGHGAAGFTRVDGDHRAVAQGHGDWRASGVGQRSGVSDLTTFGHGAGRGQR
ncbi:hypothetical protein D3C85_540620 [compost metagenome]